jgi:predicted dehydrogenase
MTIAATPDSASSSKRLRVGVAGVGYLGRFHARIYAGMPGVELVGVADVNAGAARDVATQHGCLACRDARELIGKVDAISVVVPTIYHSEVARPFLDAGVHMLMEKPVAPTYDEAKRLVEHAETAGVIFQVGHLERFNAGIMALSERCQNPRFLEVHRLGPFVDRPPTWTWSPTS